MTRATAPLPQHQPRTVTILGSTGSIGCNAVQLIGEHAGRFKVAALTAQDNVEKLIAQARALTPQLAVIGNKAHYPALKEALSGTSIRVAAGAEAIVEAASLPSDLVIAAIVGAAGLTPTLAAIRRGALIGLANKECLVCAGELMTQEIKKHRATLIPVDSEHNAIFQLFDFAKPEMVEKIIITASGGPFRTWTMEQMKAATPEQAMKHPNWSMGAKISIDSATMMNKGLEMIEAFHLFPLRREQIEVLVHPESIIHSMVCYRDGSVLAQMSAPDMRTPISFALGWPERLTTSTKRLDLAAIGKLSFEAPDETRFPALRLAREALKAGGTAPAILNAANEAAVEKFLKGKIGFLEIISFVEHALSTEPQQPLTSIDQIEKITQRINQL